jgi:RecA/RadA recombinase
VTLLNIPEEELDRAADEVTEEAMSEVTEEDLALIRRPIAVDRMVSTGSTLLDLALSGRRRRGGGVPGGIIIEIFGPTSTGKTALAVEIATSTQNRGGSVRFDDPEARLDKEYAATFGMDIREKFLEYTRSDTVTDMFEELRMWKPKSPNEINCFVADSLAALSTHMELDDSEDAKGDKRGQRRAKEFSQELRKTCRKIANNNWLLACTNQIRQGDFGYVTPGGMGIPFYASARIRLRHGKPKLLDRKRKLKVAGSEKEKEITKTVGIFTMAEVVKNSIDDSYREAMLYIIFGYGIDDIRANLQWLKNVTAAASYPAVDRDYQAMSHAIAHIEREGLQKALKENVIDAWEEIEEKMTYRREPKERG